MAANYLHGAEVIEVQRGARTIRVIKSAVVVLVGIAPLGDTNTPVMCISDKDDAQFGSPVPGFNIPQALIAIRDKGPATVIVINTFDPIANTSTVNLESHAVTTQKVKLAHAALNGPYNNAFGGGFVGPLEIFQNDGVTSAGLILGTDYTLDAYGNVKFISSNAPDGTVLKFTYKYLNAGSVTDSQLIGVVNGDGTRTGLQCSDLIYQMFGFSGKIFIAPGYSHHAAIATELTVKSNKFRGIALIDAPHGTTPTAAITARGPLGAFASFNTSSERTVLCYPYVKMYDIATNTDIDTPYSQHLAGEICAVDDQFGYWFSPSNNQMEGVTGMERFIEASIDDATSEANLLNEAGIVTVFNGFGTGFRTWGNRSAAWPSSTLPTNFMSVRRTADVIHESLILAMMQFIDKPINNATIDAIRESVNSFLRTLYAKGALVDPGSCTFNRDSNPDSEIALGHLTFDIEFMSPTPAERISFQSFINIKLLKALTAN